MPPRFFSSPFKNATATPAKREGWWSEIPVAASAPSDSADAIKATADYWLALGSASGSLVVLPYDHHGKQGSKAPTLQTGIRTITAFDTDSFDELVAVGGDGGQINVFTLPASSTFDPASPAGYSPASSLSVTSATGKAIDIVAFHPFASSLFLASSQSTISVFDAASQSAEAAYTLVAPSPSWSAQWSSDGRSITATGKDGKLRLWDVRSGGSAPTLETASHAGIKASRHVHLTSSAGPQVFTTGFSRTRDREYSLLDFRSLGNGSVKTQRVDTGTGVLVPLLDESRNIVYLAGKGDMTLRWTEIGGPSSFTEGAAPLPVPIVSAALVPPNNLDLMKAEVNRLVVLAGGGNDAVLPVSINVPRRQYLDFHADMYPAVALRQSEQTSPEWLRGEDADGLAKHTPHPNTPWPTRRAKEASSAKRSPENGHRSSPDLEPVDSSVPSVTTETAAAPTSASAPVASARAPEPVLAAEPGPTSAPSGARSETSSRSVAEVTPPHEQLTGLDVKKSTSEPQPLPKTTVPAAPSAAATGASPAATSPRTFPSNSSTPSTQQRSAPAAIATADGLFNPKWSRNFLAGKTPLKPDYFDVHDVSSTMGNDVQLLQATPLYFFFPLGGPGGRLAFHALSRKGRLPVHPSCVAIGGTITQFETDPFNPGRVFLAGDDGAIRVFTLPNEAPDEGTTISEAAQTLTDAKMDRVVELRHHPTASDLLLSLSDDRGNPTGRLWNVKTGELVRTFELPKGGISSAAWSPDGSLLGLATKNKQLHVFEPRDPVTTLRSTPSHESIRPVRLAWAAERRLMTTGFNRAASRELMLYAVDDNKLSQVGKTSLDISPAALFPFVDLDTRIALLYSRGDRSCLAFELDLDPKTPQQAFTKLPSFEHGSLQVGFAFLPKARNDVKAVEIVRALRLTQKEVEVVSFSVPRAKVDFFQNDIFIPTRDIEKPALTAADWLNGKDAAPSLLDLRPPGMKLLSDAPAPAKTVNTRSKIKQDGMTDSQREKAHLDNLFDSAKAGAASDEEEVEPVRSKHAIVDDDDW